MSKRIDKIIKKFLAIESRSDMEEIGGDECEALASACLTAQDRIEELEKALREIFYGHFDAEASDVAERALWPKRTLNGTSGIQS